MTELKVAPEQLLRALTTPQERTGLPAFADKAMFRVKQTGKDSVGTAL